jgi:hypothetical protein
MSKPRTVEGLDAIVTRPLAYEKDGQEIIVDVGEKILVDPHQGVALVNGDHIFVDYGDYELVEITLH